MPVNGMWKLCKPSEKSKLGARYSTGSEASGTDYSHERLGGKAVTTGKLREISTSPQSLLLLLVL